MVTVVLILLFIVQIYFAILAVLCGRLTYYYSRAAEACQDALTAIDNRDGVAYGEACATRAMWHSKARPKRLWVAKLTFGIIR